MSIESRMEKAFKFLNEQPSLTIEKDNQYAFVNSYFKEDVPENPTFKQFILWGYKNLKGAKTCIGEVLQCRGGHRRSLIDVYACAKTYVKNCTPEGFIKAIGELVIDKEIVLGRCYDISRIVLNGNTLPQGYIGLTKVYDDHLKIDQEDIVAYTISQQEKTEYEDTTA